MKKTQVTSVIQQAFFWNVSAAPIGQISSQIIDTSGLIGLKIIFTGAIVNASTIPILGATQGNNATQSAILDPTPVDNEKIIGVLPYTLTPSTFSTIRRPTIGFIDTQRYIQIHLDWSGSIGGTNPIFLTMIASAKTGLQPSPHQSIVLGQTVQSGVNVSKEKDLGYIKK